MGALPILPQPDARRLPDYLPARMVNEFVYCPRLFFYEWVEGVFAESGDTVEGALRHEKIRGRAEALRPADPQSTTGPAAAERVHARSVTLSSFATTESSPRSSPARLTPV